MTLRLAVRARAPIPVVMAALLLLAAPPCLEAQGRETGRPLTVRALRQIEFGQIMAGIRTRVSPSDPGAAELRVEANPGDNVLLRFVMPQRLSDARGRTLNVDYGLRSARISFEERGAENGVAFFPFAGVSYVPVRSDGLVWVYLGGTLDVPFDAAPGRYTGDVIIFVSHSGV